MTLERAREPLQRKVEVGGDYKRNAARPEPREVQPGDDRPVVLDPVHALVMQRVSGLAPGREFSNVV